MKLEALFRAEYPRLVRSLAAIYGSEQAADVVQEAFLRAHRVWSRISVYDDPGAWIRRVAMNKAANERRNVLRRRSVPLDAGVAAAAPQWPSDELLDLQRALRALPRRQRDCICLHYIGGYRIDEIAAALHIADGTVKSNMHDARCKLRTILSETDHA